MSGGVRICPYPYAKGGNPYLELFYRALEPHSFTLSRPMEYQDAFLRDHADEFDVIHIQWQQEHLWRCRGRGTAARARGLLGMLRFLRLARRMGKTIVWTIHDLEPHDGGAASDRFGAILLGRLSDLVICHDETTRGRYLKRYWGDGRRLLVMPIGNFDAVYPAPRPRAETLAGLGLDPARRTLLATGSVRAYKEYRTAVEAVAMLGPGYQLVVAGAAYPDEPEVAVELQKLAAGRPDVRLLLRTVSDQELSDLHAAADAVVLPYRWITGSAALATSLTLGRGVVASDLPYFRAELAREPQAGVLVRPSDPAALAAGVREFFAHETAGRHAAARRLADGRAWPAVVRPVAERLLALRAEGRR